MVELQNKNFVISIIYRYNTFGGIHYISMRKIFTMLTNLYNVIFFKKCTVKYKTMRHLLENKPIFSNEYCKCVTLTIDLQCKALLLLSCIILSWTCISSRIVYGWGYNLKDPALLQDSDMSRFPRFHLLAILEPRDDRLGHAGWLTLDSDWLFYVDSQVRHLTTAFDPWWHCLKEP